MKKGLSFLVGILLASQSVFAADMIQVKGSDTLINLVQKMAEEYMAETGQMISVTGGGSGTGIAAVINGTCDIGNASRLMKDKEIAQAAEKGRDVKRIVVAIDGLSVIVNPSSGVEKLTVEQIGKIFKGEITNWSEVGGKAGSISLYGRQSNSGTYEFMREEVLHGEYSDKMNRMNGNAQIVEAVKGDASGIGYVGVGYVRNEKGVTVLKVAKKEGGNYASPLDTEAVKSGVYPISRPLNQYISNPSAKVKAFIEFEISEKGQKIAEEDGFFSIPQEYVDYNKSNLM